MRSSRIDETTEVWGRLHGHLGLPASILKVQTHPNILFKVMEMMEGEMSISCGSDSLTIRLSLFGVMQGNARDRKVVLVGNKVFIQWNEITLWSK